MKPNEQKINCSLATMVGFIWGTIFLEVINNQFANGFGLNLSVTVVNFPAFCDKTLGLDILQTNYVISIITYNAGNVEIVQ